MTGPATAADSAEDPASVAGVVRAALEDRGVGYEEPQPGSFLVRLPGTHKLATLCWLVIRDHAVYVEAFFCRRPDSPTPEFYRFLLERNARMYAVAFSVDRLGDVYLTGRVPLSAVTGAGAAEEVDRLLGSVLTYADDNFDRALELGFGDAIRREWDWRVKRGESLANLLAFARFADPARRRTD